MEEVRSFLFRGASHMWTLFMKRVEWTKQRGCVSTTKTNKLLGRSKPILGTNWTLTSSELISTPQRKTWLN